MQPRILTLTFLAASVAVVVLCLGLDAWAQDAAAAAPAAPWWAGIVESLIPVAGAVVTALLSWLLAVLAKRWGLALSQEQEAALRAGIRVAIGGVEEAALARVKGGSAPMAGADKLQMALAAVQTRWPKAIPEDLVRMVHEELAQVRGVGATGNWVAGEGA